MKITRFGNHKRILCAIAPTGHNARRTTRPTAMNASHAQIHGTTGTNLESTDQFMKAAGAKCVYLLFRKTS